MWASEIARVLGGRLVGPERAIQRLMPPDQAGSDDLAAVRSPHLLELASDRGASLLCDEGLAVREGTTAVLLPSVEAAWPRVLALFEHSEAPPPGVHPTAQVAPTAHLAEGVSVGAYAVIGAEVVIEAEVVVGPFVYLGPGVHVGRGTVFEPRVVLHLGSMVGAGCRIMSGAVIGAEGFGFRNGRRLAHTGRVVLEEGVEIGPLAVVERAVVGDAVIGAQSRIGGAVYVGHNARIGRGAILVSQTGLAGSVVLGDGVVLAGQVGVADHVTIGARARVGAKSAVTKDVPPGETWLGFPARPIREYLRRLALVGRFAAWWKKEHA